jgi:L-glyceraldehyde 3-phosphate reductase
MRMFIRDSVSESLRRLRVPCLTLLQLHNSITSRRGDLPTSITPLDVLGPGGVLETFRELQSAGLVAHFGLTGIGEPAALAEVICSGAFTSIQIPYHVLNPSAGQEQPPPSGETDYGNLIGECTRQSMGVFAIRVFAGGALVNQPPSPHTLTTKFFPLDLYERDRQRAAELEPSLPPGLSLPELAVRFGLSHPGVTSALIGFSCPEQIDEAVRFCAAGPLPPELLERLGQASVSRSPIGS